MTKVLRLQLWAYSQHSTGCLVVCFPGMMSSLAKVNKSSGAHFQMLFSKNVLFFMFLHIQIELIILKRDDKQFTLTTKKSLHITFKSRQPSQSNRRHYTGVPWCWVKSVMVAGVVTEERQGHNWRQRSAYTCWAADGRSLTHQPSYSPDAGLNIATTDHAPAAQLAENVLLQSYDPFNTYNKCSALAQMGDRLATVDMDR